LERNKELEISNKLIKLLKEKGFEISKYYAKTTKSIYLKLDYGVCCGIRISDHNGKKKYKYKFNLLKYYNGPKRVNDNGYIRLFYDYENINELIEEVLREKNEKLQKYGQINYHEYMRINSTDKLYKSFRKVA